MKPKRKLVVVLLVIGVAVALLRMSRPPSNPEVTNDNNVTNGSSLDSNSILGTNPVAASTVRESVVSNEDVIQSIRQDLRWAWKRPIAFYGKALDESGQPIPGATAVFGWSNEKGEGREATKVSDGSGFFSLVNAQGKSLQVRVRAPGYYSFASNRISFEYAIPSEANYHRPDILNPVVFTLKRKGEAEPLVLANKTFRIRKDGTPVYVDLVKGKQSTTDSSHLQVRCWTSEKDENFRQYDWKCEISVPEGGVLESTQELDFVAPMHGYTPTLEISMPKALIVGWTSHVEKQLFLKTRGGIYARLNFTMIAGGDHFFKIESFINPSGSRNLEFDPERQQKETSFQ